MFQSQIGDSKGLTRPIMRLHRFPGDAAHSSQWLLNPVSVT